MTTSTTVPAVSKPEVVWVLRGKPVDPNLPMWPATIFDLRSRRLRFQMVNKHLLFPLMETGGTAKFSAIWCSSAGANGRWQLIDVVPDHVREVA